MINTLVKCFPGAVDFPSTAAADFTTTANTDPRVVIAFDTTTVESVIFPVGHFPQQYNGGALIIRGTGIFDTATSSNARMDFQIEAISDTEAGETDSFSSANSVSIAAPGTVGNTVEFTVTLSADDYIAIGDVVRVKVTRQTGHIDDAASGDFFLLALSIEE